MIHLPETWRRGIPFALVVVIVLLLAACGGGDGSDGSGGSGGDSPPPSAQTPAPGPTGEVIGDTVIIPAPATAGPIPTATPYLLPSEPVFKDAGALARVDLAERLNISIQDAVLLDPDTVLYLDKPLLCPEVEDGQQVHYVFVRYQQEIFPYQVYPPAREGESPDIDRCEDVLIAENVLYVPDFNPAEGPLTAVKTDLVARGVDPEAGAFTLVTATTWPDDALGCPAGAGITEPAPAEISGYLVVYELDGRQYEYHTDDTGATVVYCAPPPGVDSAVAFIAGLLEDPELGAELIPLEEERPVYQGLDAEGQFVTLTDSADRIAVFEMPSPEAARAAALAVDGGGISHIFVSGRVLIIQEENSLAVYSLMIQRAEEVRDVEAERRRDPGPDAEEEEDTLTEQEEAPAEE